MGTSIETDAAAVRRRRIRGQTTIKLETTSDDDWRATQDGVDVVGRGESAALAAAEYCRRVEDADE